MMAGRSRRWLDRVLDYAVPSLTLLVLTWLVYSVLARRLGTGWLVVAQVGLGIPVYKTTGYAYRRWLRPAVLQPSTRQHSG